MRRIVPNRTTVIALACAMLVVCARAGFAQPDNDDRYGFIPMPPVTMPPAASEPGQQRLTPPAQEQQRFQPPPVQQRLSAPPVRQAQKAVSSPPSPPQQAATPVTVPAPDAAPQPRYGYAPLPPLQPLQPVESPAAATAVAPQTEIAANPSPPYAATSGQNVASEYVLGSGDKLRVSVFGEDDLTGEYQIDGSGMVRLPLIGTLRAAGYTAPALEYAITGALARGYLKNPRVNVEITAYRPFFIIGAVNRPGQYPYVDNMSALNAVAYGGGFTDQARQSTVYIRHEGSTEEDAVPASQITRVLPGDVIRVKDTVFWDVMSIFTPIAGPAVLAAAALH